MEQEEVVAMMKETGFDVDEVSIVDLADVKEERQLIPPTQDVKLSVKNAGIREFTDKDTGLVKMKKLDLQLQLVGGINAEGKYRNKIVFGGCTIFASPEAVNNKGQKYADQEWFQKKQYLVDFKKWFVGMEKKDGSKTPVVFTVADPSKVNDTFLQELIGQVCIGNIIQTKGTDQYEPNNDVKNLRPVPVESMV